MDHILYFLNRRKVKYSLAFISVILGLIFTVQQYIIYHEMKVLNRQIQQSGAINNNRMMLKERKIKYLTSQFKDEDFSNELMEEISLSRKDLNTIFHEYDKLRLENEILRSLLNDSLINKFYELKSLEMIIVKKKKQGIKLLKNI